MLIKHFYVEKIAHSSYMLAGNEVCAIVDPRRDVDFYIEEAEKAGLKITHILETHLHADFVSGHMELSLKTGARIYVPKSAECSFPCIELKENDEFEIEDMRIKVLETPGHTPEHISYVVTDLSRGTSPIGVFAGDTLFVGDVGRPDLFPDRAEELASKLYDSLHNKLLKLPDYCEVYPAHGAGSLCGKSMGAKYTTTIGYEKRYNPILQIQDIDGFTSALTKDMPEVPDHFARCSDINRKGPLTYAQMPELKIISPEQFENQINNEDIIILDVRKYYAFGGMHIPGSYNIGYNGNLPTFAGWVLPPEKKVLIVAENFEMAQEWNVWIKRVGIDNAFGYLRGGIYDLASGGKSITKREQLSPEEVEKMQGENLIILDSRDEAAYKKEHIEGSVNIPAHDLRTR